MTHPTFTDLLQRLRDADESSTIEAKRGRQVDRSCMETVCAFANEPHGLGGYLLLGVARDDATLFPTYEIVGVPQPEKLQNDLVTQCRTRFNVPVRIEVFTERIGEHQVVWAYVPEAAVREKPIYFAADGLPGGAFRRIASSDQRCTDEDVRYLHQLAGGKPYDETPLDEVDPTDDFDPAAIAAYRRDLAKANPDAEALRWSDPELLYAVGATARRASGPVATLCGLVTFGSAAALRRHLPMCRVDYIRVPGREWVPDPDERYQTVEMRGPLITLIPRVVSQVLDDIPKAFAWSEDQVHRRDVPIIPQKVIREAVVNALMHRSYYKHRPVQLLRYSNRLEIRNAGFSLKPDDRLGEPGSEPRNPRIAAILHDALLAETKGSGIRVMRDLMHRANLTLPTFESDREADEFQVTFLLHHFLTEEDLVWLGHFQQAELTDDEAKALIFVREVGAITNGDYRDINTVDTLVASGHLRRLRDHGLLEQKGKGSGTYYLPGTRLLQVGSPEATSGLPNRAHEAPPPRPEAGTPDLSRRTPDLGTRTPDLSSVLKPLPPQLLALVQALGERTQPAAMEQALVALCRWEALRLDQLAVYTGRRPEYLRKSPLRRLLQSGQIRYRYPDTPNHPHQRYVATPE